MLSRRRRRRVEIDRLLSLIRINCWRDGSTECVMRIDCMVESALHCIALAAKISYS